MAGHHQDTHLPVNPEANPNPSCDENGALYGYDQEGVAGAQSYAHPAPIAKVNPIEEPKEQAPDWQGPPEGKQPRKFVRSAKNRVSAQEKRGTDEERSSRLQDSHAKKSEKL